MYEIFEKLLEEHQKTAYQVSKDTGIATATLTEWKKGTYTPKIDKLKVIADYFDVPVTIFIKQGGDHNETDANKSNPQEMP